MKRINKFGGFTLIELLVVITIIAILATVGINQFGTTLQKARDSKRTSDLMSIKTTISQTFTDEQAFPSTKASDFRASVKPYIEKLPVDGKNGQPGNNYGEATGNGGNESGNKTSLGYVYFSGDDDNGISNASYELSTAFEAEANVKNIAMTDDGDDDNRQELGAVSRNFVTQLKKDSTCTTDNETITNAIVIGGDILCTATPY